MADYWSETGKLFSSLIQKPKMTEKLLKKPPPKYIYDIILNTMKATGFPKGLYTPEEEDHKYFESDAHHKLDILQKAIDITKIVMNENFDIKCTNILKGEQPEKTNYFLQLFYKAATNGKDNSALIQKYLEKKNKKEEKKAEPAMPSNFGNASKPKTEKIGMKMEKPKGMISEGGKDMDQNDSNPTDSIKIGGGIGMKLDKKIFVHEDLTESRSEIKKPRVDNVDLEAIKEYVQQITSNCNPLGKLVDLLGDDIESMNKELANWIKDNKVYKDRFDDEMKKSDETLLPLQNELLELEDSIRDEQTQIKAIKSRLIKNEKIIQNLITNVISFKSEQS
jgi:TRAF3-interacting protein 1